MDQYFIQMKQLMNEALNEALSPSSLVKTFVALWHPVVIRYCSKVSPITKTGLRGDSANSLALLAFDSYTRAQCACEVNRISRNI